LKDRGQGIARLKELRARIASLQAMPELSEADFDEVALSLRKIAVETLGAASPRAKALNVRALSSAQLAQIGKRSRKVPIVMRGKTVTRILGTPGPSHTEYYRKRLIELDEEITLLLLEWAREPPL
jgi:hypothetical protein